MSVWRSSGIWRIGDLLEICVIDGMVGPLVIGRYGNILVIIWLGRLVVLEVYW